MKFVPFSTKVICLMAVVAFVVHPLKVNAAKGLGMVVTSKGDTLVGTIYHRGFNRMIKVTLVQNDAETVFSPQEIKAFWIGPQRWESIHLAENGSRPDQYLFLKVIEHGGVLLLKGRYIVDGCGCDDFPKNALATGYFLKRQDGKVIQVFVKAFNRLKDPEYVGQFLKTPGLSKSQWVGMPKLRAVVKHT